MRKRRVGVVNTGVAESAITLTYLGGSRAHMDGVVGGVLRQSLEPIRHCGGEERQEKPHGWVLWSEKMGVVFDARYDRRSVKYHADSANRTVVLRITPPPTHPH